MTLTPEQFNILATKDDLKDLENKFVTKDEFNEKMDIVISMLEKSAKKESDHEIEHVSNIAAHDRFEVRIARTEKELKLDPIYS